MGYDYYFLMMHWEFASVVEWELELLSSSNVFVDIEESHCPVVHAPAVITDCC